MMGINMTVKHPLSLPSVGAVNYWNFLFPFFYTWSLTLRSMFVFHKHKDALLTITAYAAEF